MPFESGGDKLLEEMKSQFYDHISNPSYPGDFNLPSNAICYLLLSPRLMEVVKHPDNIRPNIHFWDSETFKGSVHYWDPLPIIEGLGVVQSHRRRRMSDYQVFQLKLDRAINKRGDRVLKVNDFTVNEKYRGVGIGTSFYDRLRECAKAMNFFAIMGLNRGASRSFFLEKLGRKPLSSVKLEYLELFEDKGYHLKEHDLRNWTVDLLDRTGSDEYFDQEEVDLSDKAKQYHNLKLYGHLV